MTQFFNFSEEREKRRPALPAEVVTLYRGADGRLDSAVTSGPLPDAEGTRALALDLIDVARWMLLAAADMAGDKGWEPAMTLTVFMSSRMRVHLNTGVTDRAWCMRRLVQGLDSVLPPGDPE